MCCMLRSETGTVESSGLSSFITAVIIRFLPHAALILRIALGNEQTPERLNSAGFNVASRALYSGVLRT